MKRTLTLLLVVLSAPVAAAPTLLGNNLVVDGTLGIGTSGAGGQAIHIANGNLLVDGAGENAYIMKRSGVIGLRTDPIFQMGRIVAGGVNEPIFRWMYSDASNPERQILDIESTGTIAVITDNTRRTYYEAYTLKDQQDPTFRLNAYPGMQLEQGAGGAEVVAGAATCAANVVTATSSIEHGLAPGQTITVVDGSAGASAQFPAGSYTIVTTPTQLTFTASGTCTNGSTTVSRVFSANTDTFVTREIGGRLTISADAQDSVTSATVPAVALQCGLDIANTDLCFAVFDSTGTNLLLRTTEEGNTTSLLDLVATRYIDTSSNAGAPAAGDCDQTEEQGRIVVDHTNDRLYICNFDSGRAWDYAALTD